MPFPLYFFQLLILKALRSEDVYAFGLYVSGAYWLQHTFGIVHCNILNVAVFFFLLVAGARSRMFNPTLHVLFHPCLSFHRFASFPSRECRLIAISWWDWLGNIYKFVAAWESKILNSGSRGSKPFVFPLHSQILCSSIFQRSFTLSNKRGWILNLEGGCIWARLLIYLYLYTTALAISQNLESALLFQNCRLMRIHPWSFLYFNLESLNGVAALYR